MRQPPYNGTRVQETLDMVLTAAAFDQQVSMLFCDDGVLQLVRNQEPQALELKNTARILDVLEMYDVRNLYVESESLIARGLAGTDLVLPVRLVPRSGVNALLSGRQILIQD